MESSSVNKESHWGQAYVRGVPAWKPREGIVWSCEGEARLCWRPQDVGDAMGYLLMRAANREWLTAQERSMLQATKQKGVGDLKNASTSDMESAEFGVCPSGFWSCFGPVSPYYSPFPPFWNGSVYPGPLYIQSMWSAFSFWFYSVIIKSIRDFEP